MRSILKYNNFNSIAKSLSSNSIVPYNIFNIYYVANISNYDEYKFYRIYDTTTKNIIGGFDLDVYPDKKYAEIIYLFAHKDNAENIVNACLSAIDKIKMENNKEYIISSLWKKNNNYLHNDCCDFCSVNYYEHYKKNGYVMCYSKDIDYVKIIK
jgi:hypothetical protein